MRYDIKKTGTTLVELMVACGIFSLLVVCLFAILKFCTNSWKDVEDKTKVEKQIRSIQYNISEELRKASFTSVVIHDLDYRHAISFKSAMNNEGSNFVVDDFGNPEWQKYVLYYVVRPLNDPCQASAAGIDMDTTADNLCPHKFVMRVDLTLDANLANKSDLTPYLATGMQTADSSSEEYTQLLTSTYQPMVIRAYSIGRDVLSFNIYQANPSPEILIDIKCFRILEAGSIFSIGGRDLSAHPYTIQVDNRIIPQNP